MSLRPPVTRCRRSRARLVVAGAVALLAGCGKDAPPPRGERASAGAADTAAAADLGMPIDDRGWLAEAGPVLYLPSDAGSVRVVLPRVGDDSVPQPAAAVLPSAAAPAPIDLFGPTGLVGRGSVGAFAADGQTAPVAGCDAWPELPLRRDDAGGVPWRVGLVAGAAEALVLDSAETLAMRDSASLVRDIVRATATLATDSAAAGLARVPFNVLAAHRARLPDSTELLLAVVERRINSEADPRVERTTLVLERAPGARAHAVAWQERQFVTEDEIVSVEILGALRLVRTRTPLVLLGLDFGDGTRLEVLERTGPGAWRVRWSSAYTGC